MLKWFAVKRIPSHIESQGKKRPPDTADRLVNVEQALPQQESPDL